MTRMLAWGAAHKRSLSILAALVVAALGFSALFDGGQFARLNLVGGKLTPEIVLQPQFPGQQQQPTVALAIALA